MTSAECSSETEPYTCGNIMPYRQVTNQVGYEHGVLSGPKCKQACYEKMLRLGIKSGDTFYCPAHSSWHCHGSDLESEPVLTPSCDGCVVWECKAN